MNRAGTLRWQAPELWLDSGETSEAEQQNTKASDIYAFGSVCYEVCCMLIQPHQRKNWIFTKRCSLATRHSMMLGMNFRSCWQFCQAKGHFGHVMTCHRSVAWMTRYGILLRLAGIRSRHSVPPVAKFWSYSRCYPINLEINDPPMTLRSHFHLNFYILNSNIPFLPLLPVQVRYSSSQCWTKLQVGYFLYVVAFYLLCSIECWEESLSYPS
jgi:hypothetical protein